MARFHPDLPAWQRIAILEDALAEVLDIDETMWVERGMDGERAVYVIDGMHSDSSIGHDLYAIARALERLLA
jgi:hypothetical protein